MHSSLLRHERNAKLVIVSLLEALKKILRIDNSDLLRFTTEVKCEVHTSLSPIVYITYNLKETPGNVINIGVSS